MKNTILTLSLISIFLLAITSCESTDEDYVDPFGASYNPFAGGPTTTTTPTIVEDGLNAHYPFNGNANDATGYENDGYLYGPTLTTDRNGNGNSAYLFNGNQDKINVLDDSKLHVNEKFTLMAWVNPSTTKTQYIILKGSTNVANPISIAYGLSLSQTDDYIFTVSTTSQSKQLRLNDYDTNAWQFIVGVKDGSSLKLYVNGVKVDEDTITGNIVYDGGSTLQIGSRSAGQSNYGTFNGKIDDIKIYEKAFTEAEVLQYYNDNL